MKLPSVAIVGRPNVGKSSYLNAVIGRRVSIVHDRPGVTRDRVSVEVVHAGRVFDLVDMGGIGIVDTQDLDRDVEIQINAAIEAADVIVFIVDVRDGPTTLDAQVATVIRKTSKPVVFVANKVESERHRLDVDEFQAFGLGRPIEISCIHGSGIGDSLDAVTALLPPREADEAPSLEGETLIAIVGQRNAGKSTLVNALAGEERVIVSEVPGTTRDAVDVRVRFGERTFTVIDTAGMRKGKKLADSVEFYSQQRAHQSIERAQVVLLLLDAMREVSQVDKKIADAILEARKPCVLAVNKWDLAGDVDTGKWFEYLEKRLPLFHYAPVVFVSAKDRVRLRQLVDVAFDLHDQGRHRVPTAELNEVVGKASAVRGPRVGRGQFPKIYYATQVGVHPPWIVLFVNDPKLFKDDFRRFLENRFREAFPFSEIPIRISFRQRQSIF